MTPISIRKFAEMTVKNNKGMDLKELTASLEACGKKRRGFLPHLRRPHLGGRKRRHRDKYVLYLYHR